MVEHNLAKVGVASSSLVSRSKIKTEKPPSTGGFFVYAHAPEVTILFSNKHPMEPNLFLIIPLVLGTGLIIGIGAGMLLGRKAPWIPRKIVAIEASTVSGRGAFALKKIKEGDIIERCPALEVTDKDIGGELLNYVFYGKTENSRLVAMGNGMLFNHSSTPNVAYYREETSLGPELILYALRDISKGEELFYTYGDDWWNTRQ